MNACGVRGGLSGDMLASSRRNLVLIGLKLSFIKASNRALLWVSADNMVVAASYNGVSIYITASIVTWSSNVDIRFPINIFVLIPCIVTAACKTAISLVTRLSFS